MIRNAKKATALTVALLMIMLQLHSVIHLLGHDGHGHGKAPCAVCDTSLSQVAIHSSGPALALEIPCGFIRLKTSIPNLTQQVLSFSPSLRGPPAVS
jgi:hypothetical protein